MQHLQPLIDQLTTVLGSQIPNLVGAMAILAVGWVIALMVAGMVKKLMHQTTLDSRLAGVFFPGDHTKAIDIQKWTGQGVFFLLMFKDYGSSRVEQCGTMTI